MELYERAMPAWMSTTLVLRAGIVEGRFGPLGSKLPAIAELASVLAVGHRVVRGALALLQYQGFVQYESGRWLIASLAPVDADYLASLRTLILDGEVKPWEEFAAGPHLSGLGVHERAHCIRTLGCEGLLSTAGGRWRVPAPSAVALAPRSGITRAERHWALKHAPTDSAPAGHTDRVAYTKEHDVVVDVATGPRPGDRRCVRFDGWDDDRIDLAEIVGGHAPSLLALVERARADEGEPCDYDERRLAPIAGFSRRLRVSLLDLDGPALPRLLWYRSGDARADGYFALHVDEEGQLVAAQADRHGSRDGDVVGLETLFTGPQHHDGVVTRIAHGWAESALRVASLALTKEGISQRLIRRER